MVAKGVLVDQVFCLDKTFFLSNDDLQIIANSNPPKEFVKITQSLEQLATELDKEGDGLVIFFPPISIDNFSG